VALRLENQKPEGLLLAIAWWGFGLLSRVFVDILFYSVEARSGNFQVVRFMDPRRAVALRRGTPSRVRGDGDAVPCIHTKSRTFGKFRYVCRGARQSNGKSLHAALKSQCHRRRFQKNSEHQDSLSGVSVNRGQPLDE